MQLPGRMVRAADRPTLHLRMHRSGGLPMTTDSQPFADRNVLFGVLALQLGFVTRDALIDALNAWAADKSRPLGDLLCNRGDVAAERRRLLDALVDEHLGAHGGDPRRSLASLPPSDGLGPEAFADPDLQA